MRTLTDDIVITDANQEGFNIAAAALRVDEPLCIVLCGPVGSGKSTVLQARGRERDLLAPKHGTYAHGKEIAAAINLDVNEGFLERVADVDVLYLDGVNELMEEGEQGLQIVRLLLAERGRRHLSTVVAFDGTEDELKESPLAPVFKDYTVVSVGTLDEAGLEAFARNMIERFGDSEGAPVLTDEAVAYLVSDFAQEAQDIRNAVRYLLTADRFEAGHEITRDEAAEALAS